MAVAQLDEDVAGAVSGQEDIKAAKGASKKPKGVVVVVSVVDLRDAYTGVPYPSGVPVHVKEVTSWLQAQIDADLIRRL